jgi:mannose-1-phosphate guanylyltransferase
MKREKAALILAGGSGTRFWPMSTENKPKQFLPIAGELPLITQTFKRLTKIVQPDRIFVIADEKFMALTLAALPELNKANYIIEPSPRNTAPSLILANIFLTELLGGDCNLAVVPADHYIPDEEVFVAQISQALEYADHPCMITSGIKPTSAHTGYGYIKFSPENYQQINETRFYAVQEFKEKPAPDTADAYLKAGCYYWNSGMFIYKLNHFKSFFASYAPDFFEQYQALAANFQDAPLRAAVFNRMTRESIDYALMEKIKDVRMFPARFTWNDVGAWSSMYELNPKDSSGNAVTDGDHVMIDCQNSMIVSDSKIPIAAIGVKNIAVIHTKNGILIADLNRTQDVKKVVDLLKERNQ